jgi:hypothetical protein
MILGSDEKTRLTEMIVEEENSRDNQISPSQSRS